MTSGDRDTVPTDPLLEGQGSESRSSASAAGKPKKKALQWWLKSILLLAGALGLAIVGIAFSVRAFYIPSESMEPGLVKNDRILVQKWSYWGSGTPQRGDVIVFKVPGNWLGLDDGASDMAKRVIGVAGDMITCCDEQGRILVNGVPLDEPYLENAQLCNGPMLGCHWKDGPVPPGDLFVMGDHRDDSADSSFHICRANQSDCVPGDEFVSVDLVVGKVFALVGPSDHVGWIKRPATFEDLPAPS